MKEKKRIYKFKKLPYEEDLRKFVPPYTPENFTEEEKFYLNPFFSNVDKPIFAISHLPEEVMGAISSRYSRATVSLRRIFLKEYISPVIYPEKQKNWIELSQKEKATAKETKKKFKTIVKFLNKTGGVDFVVNIQRARKFFDVWLAQYGDDSIAELGGVHVCLEGASSLVIEEIVNKRVGISPLVKSTRYVSFTDKRPDGHYQYIVPGELKGTKHEKSYKQAMDLLFDTYSKISEPYFNYICELYPKGEDETDSSFRNSRGAKRFDDLRELLPFATQNNIALFGNGRAFEDLINRMMNHPLGEIRWWGKVLCDELEKVVPSFVRRPRTERGAELQIYRTNMKYLRDEISKDLLDSKISSQQKWVKLMSHTQDAEVEILSTYLFAGNQRLSLFDLRKKVNQLSPKKRAELLKKILDERKFGRMDSLRERDRFKKPTRAFENAHYLFEIWGRGGDYRDLHRHRQNTEDHSRFTCFWGYDLEKEVLASPFIKEIEKVLESVGKEFKKLEKFSPEVAQYLVPFAYLQHWYMNLSAREIYWMVELRTGPQGRPHYREICQQIGIEANIVSPAIFQGLLIDLNDYGLARRESEKRIERKIKQLIAS